MPGTGLYILNTSRTTTRHGTRGQDGRTSGGSAGIWKRIEEVCLGWWYRRSTTDFNTCNLRNSVVLNVSVADAKTGRTICRVSQKVAKGQVNIQRRNGLPSITGRTTTFGYLLPRSFKINVRLLTPFGGFGGYVSMTRDSVEMDTMITQDTGRRWAILHESRRSRLFRASGLRSVGPAGSGGGSALTCSDLGRGRNGMAGMQYNSE